MKDLLPDELLKALVRKTGGRVIRLDTGVPGDAFREGEIREDRNDRRGAKLESRYIQYTIDDSKDSS